MEAAVRLCLGFHHWLARRILSLAPSPQLCSPYQIPSKAVASMIATTIDFMVYMYIYIYISPLLPLLPFFVVAVFLLAPRSPCSQGSSSGAVSWRLDAKPFGRVGDPFSHAVPRRRKSRVHVCVMYNKLHYIYMYIYIYTHTIHIYIYIYKSKSIT